MIQNGLNIGAFAVAVAVGVPFLLASVLAAVVALAVSFFAQPELDLRRHEPNHQHAIGFITVWVAIVLLALPVLALLVDVAHLPKVLAQAVVIIVGAPASYVAQRRWTFR